MSCSINRRKGGKMNIWNWTNLKGKFDKLKTLKSGEGCAQVPLKLSDDRSDFELNVVSGGGRVSRHVAEFVESGVFRSFYLHPLCRYSRGCQVGRGKNYDLKPDKFKREIRQIQNIEKQKDWARSPEAIRRPQWLRAYFLTSWVISDCCLMRAVFPFSFAARLEIWFKKSSLTSFSDRYTAFIWK